MKLKRAASTAVTAVAGLAANYPASWILTMWSPYRQVTRPPVPATGYPFDAAGPWGMLGWWETQRGVGVRSDQALAATGFEGDFKEWCGTAAPARYQSGWPCLSVESAVRARDHQGTRLSRWQLPVGEVLRRGFNTSDLPGWFRAQPQRRLGLLPVWPGFAINGALFIAATLGLARGAGTIRRRVRLRG